MTSVLNPGQTLSRTSLNLHTKSPSNPFEVIYEAKQSHQAPSNPRWHNSYNYEEISKNIHHHTPSSAIPLSPSTPPILTILNDQLNNDSPVRSTGSIVSRSATVRNRHRIIGRNKTVKRKDLDEKKPFKFPIRRKRSLNYKSSNGHFSTKKEMLEYMKKSGYDALVHKLIPSRMILYKYKRILQPKPRLTYTMQQFELDALDNYNVVKPPKSKEIVLKSNIKFMDVAYGRYQQDVYSGRYTVPPPRFQDLYPQDALLLNDDELYQINTKILFEILLRKTVAAKMGYRLNITGNHNSDSSSQYPSSDSRGTSSTSSCTSGDYSETKPLFHGLDISREPKRDLRNEFVNDFNKTYKERYHTKSPFEEALFESNVYQLKPMARSKSTLSSNDDDDDEDHYHQQQHQHVPEDVTSAHTSSKLRSGSSHTSNTSVLQTLDDLSSDLNSFLEAAFNPPPDIWKSKNVVPKSIISPEQLIESMNRSDKIGYLARPVERESPVRVSSMQASLLTHQDSIATKLSSTMSPKFSQASRFGSVKNKINTSS